MSTQAIKDQMDIVVAARATLKAANDALDTAKANRDSAMSALSVAQTTLGDLIAAENVIGGDYTLKHKGQ